MELSPDFAFRPQPAIENETLQPFPQVASPLGPLAPLAGKWTANTAFLKGGADGPNATAVSVACTFWLETLQGQSAPTQLQYTQTVLLNFNGISWPHVTVGTLHKA